MQVEGHQDSSLLELLATGARVSNAYPTCRIVGHSPQKGGLMPDVVIVGHPIVTEDLLLCDGDASD